MAQTSPDKAHRSCNLFLALMPDAQAATKAQTLAMSLGSEQGVPVSPARIARFHVTLFHAGKFMGDIPANTLQSVRQVAQSMASRPFEVSLDRMGSFTGKPGRLPVVLLGAASAGLMQFQADLDRKMGLAGFTHSEPGRPYRPHLTLFYGRSPVPESAIAPIVWQVQDFVLIRSVVGEGVYIEEGRWTLRPGETLHKRHPD